MDKSLELPVYLFHQGTSAKAYELMGAHHAIQNGTDGFIFRVWAPNAKSIAVTGDFNNWDNTEFTMEKITSQGIWQIFIPHIKEYTSYKYCIEDSHGNKIMKADPYGFHMETRPQTASKTFNIERYDWKDLKWRNRQQTRESRSAPMNIYEVHLGSWRKYQDGNYFDYYKLADELIPYVIDMGYTHLELMPVSEYPFDGSWGYQVTGYYAPTSRYGSPEGFMYFVDACHLAGIYVILDWVPGHFPKDSNGLYRFDGSSCYEYDDPLKSEHEEWGTMIFDWGRNEVRSFLISNAMFWMDKYHIDGIRVDAVASMLYLDYGRQEGKWRQNVNGGRENLEAVSFIRDLNKIIFEFYPNALMIAEESTAWPMVTMPVHLGGLGFNFKWNMGWMNDTLQYIRTDPFFRKGVHNNLTFPLTYFSSENFILPLSHDEVVHGKGSLLNKMPGDYESKFANLRTYLAYMIAHPGKKLLFMGGELAQFSEWDFNKELDWGLLAFDMHKKFHDFIKELNLFYIASSELWELDNDWDGFQWICPDNSDCNVVIFRRINKNGDELIIACNFSPVYREKYQIGVPKQGVYQTVFHSGLTKYGGTCNDSESQIKADPIRHDGYDYSIKTDLPGLCTIFWR